MRNPSLDQLAQRDLALTIACRYCGAKIGEPCIVKDRLGTHELTNLPAHAQRINRAERVQRMADEPKPDTTPIVDKLADMRSTMVNPI